MPRRDQEEEESYDLLSLTRAQRLGEKLVSEKSAELREAEITQLSLFGRLALSDYRRRNDTDRYRHIRRADYALELQEVWSSLDKKPLYIGLGELQMPDADKAELGLLLLAYDYLARTPPTVP